APAVAWDGVPMLEDVLAQLGEDKVELRGGVRAIEVQDLELDDPGHLGLERALGYLPGADVFPDRRGVIVVRDTLNGGEDEVLARLDRKQVSDLDATVVDRSYVRPGEVVVLFTPEPECRLTSVEEGDAQVDQPSLVNVGVVPDPYLTVNGRNV